MNDFHVGDTVRFKDRDHRADKERWHVESVSPTGHMRLREGYTGERFYGNNAVGFFGPRLELVRRRA